MRDHQPGQFSFQDQDGEEHICTRTDGRSPRCSHRRRSDPLPCAVPSCLATAKSPMVITWRDEEGRTGGLRMKRKIGQKEWEWVPA